MASYSANVGAILATVVARLCKIVPTSFEMAGSDRPNTSRTNRPPSESKLATHQMGSWSYHPLPPRPRWPGSGSYSKNVFIRINQTNHPVGIATGGSRKSGCFVHLQLVTRGSHISGEHISLLHAMSCKAGGNVRICIIMRTNISDATSVTPVPVCNLTSLESLKLKRGARIDIRHNCDTRTSAGARVSGTRDTALVFCPQHP